MFSSQSCQCEGDPPPAAFLQFQSLVGIKTVQNWIDSIRFWQENVPGNETCVCTNECILSAGGAAHVDAAFDGTCNDEMFVASEFGIQPTRTLTNVSTAWPLWGNASAILWQEFVYKDAVLVVQLLPEPVPEEEEYETGAPTAAPTVAAATWLSTAQLEVMYDEYVATGGVVEATNLFGTIVYPLFLVDASGVMVRFAQ